MLVNKARTLFIVNKALPDNDYRLDYGSHSSVCDVVYGLPERACTLPNGKFVRLGFEEGFHSGVFKALLDLFVYLRAQRRHLDFVHFFTTNPILFGPIVSRFTGVDAVITFTGFGRVMTSPDRKYGFLRPFYRFLLRHSVRTARLVLFQNKTDLAQLRTKYPDQAHKYHFVGSTTSMGVVTEKDFDKEPLVVLLAARLMPEKGVPDFLEVARTLQASGFRFLLAGKESVGYGALYAEILQADREGIIEFQGELDTPDMEALLAETHILLFPSHYGEGLSRLMLEAGHALLCPVAYNIPSNRDLVAEGRGFLVETGDLKRIIQILSSLAADRSQAKRNALAYQAFILEHYGRTQFTRRLDRLFQDMLGRPDSSEGSFHESN